MINLLFYIFYITLLSFFIEIAFSALYTNPIDYKSLIVDAF